MEINFLLILVFNYYFLQTLVVYQNQIHIYYPFFTHIFILRVTYNHFFSKSNSFTLNPKYLVSSEWYQLKFFQQYQAYKESNHPNFTFLWLLVIAYNNQICFLFFKKIYKTDYLYSIRFKISYFIKIYYSIFSFLL